ncbi:MAG: hypothetical protein GC158_02475 [Cyanobacteria bacterium RI_101]|nr:hypothetical protein [Cyanobacteria bacterium RI_101]
MSFNTYKSIGEVVQDYPIFYQENNFIQEIPLEINSYFRQRLNLVLREGIVFNSEYAICENIISPILLEVWQSYRHDLLVWSHQPLRYDDNLSGIPDYMVARRSPRGKIILEAPYLIVVEAKKDNFEEGWGQCLVEMITAQKLNINSQVEIFGIVSNGKIWEFGKLFNTNFEKNIQFYNLSDLDNLFSALNFIFQKSQSYVTQDNVES